MLQFQPDAERIFARQEAWWRGEPLHPVNLSVLAPRAGVVPRQIPRPATLEEQWTNIDYVLEREFSRMEALAFLGDALPRLRVGLGPSFITATLGCPLRFLPDTTWTAPLIADWETFEGFSDYRENPWYKLSIEMMERSAAAAKGRCVVLLPDLHPGGDGVASLRGSEHFMLDLYDHPGRVRQALDHLDRMTLEMVETYYRIAVRHGHRGSSGFTAWGPGKTFPIQDDMLALVSPAMTRDFLLPGILRQARAVDHAMFHLDGPECLNKLDLLLEAPEIHGIQWVPGAAHREMTQWIPLMQRILKAGKLLMTECRPHELDPILREVPSRGLRLGVCAESEEQGRDLLRLAAGLTG